MLEVELLYVKLKEMWINLRLIFRSLSPLFGGVLFVIATTNRLEYTESVPLFQQIMHLLTSNEQVNEHDLTSPHDVIIITIHI